MEGRSSSSTSSLDTAKDGRGKRTIRLFNGFFGKFRSKADAATPGKAVVVDESVKPQSAAFAEPTRPPQLPVLSSFEAMHFVVHRGVETNEDAAEGEAMEMRVGLVMQGQSRR
jgi:hypothetical protein